MHRRLFSYQMKMRKPSWYWISGLETMRYWNEKDVETVMEKEGSRCLHLGWRDGPVRDVEAPAWHRKLARS